MPTLVYDGECSLCRRAVAWVEQRDGSGAIELLPFQDPGFAARFPEIPRSQCLNAAQFVAASGRVVAGAAAVREVLLLLPSTRWLGRALRVPPVFWLAQLSYALVARLRPRDNCARPSA